MIWQFLSDFYSGLAHVGVKYRYTQKADMLPHLYWLEVYLKYISVQHPKRVNKQSSFHIRELRKLEKFIELNWIC